MPKPKAKPVAVEPAPRISDVEYVMRSLLNALYKLDRSDKFRLAAVVMWMRGEWRGDSAVLEDVEGALRLIDAMTERERRQATEMAADSNLRAAVTA